MGFNLGTTPLRKMRDHHPKHRANFGLRQAKISSKFSSYLLGLLLASLIGANFAPANAQILPSKPAPAPVTSSTAAPSDPQGLGRETPRGTVIGFIRAAQAENYDLAIQYFEPRRRSASSSDDQELAAQLLAILNSRFPSTDSVTDDPEGRFGDGVPRSQITVGLTRTMGESFPLSLIRIEGPRGTRLWYITRQTLERVPEIYYSLRYPQIEKRLPRFLVQTRPLEMPLWQWLAIVSLAPIAFALGWLAVFLVLGAWQLVCRARGLPADQLRPFRRFGPETLLAAAIIHYNLVSWIGTSLLYRQYYRDTIWIFVAFGIYWAATRIIYRISVHVWTSLTEKGRLAERSLISLGRRFLDVLLFVLIGLIVLRSMGLDVTAALAGLGIGGLAIGLGAQKTFENLLGGIAILTDRALVVGDPCKIGDRTGVVEDIGLRSTKLRTEDRTVVSIPNGTVATATLENYRLRDKILFRQVVRLRYDLTADHVRYTLAEIREILAHHPKVEEGTWRVRVLRFADYSIDVEVYVYILDRDYLQFLAIQEQLLLQIMEVVERTGATVAQPTQTTLVTRDNWVDPEKAAAAQKAIEKGQDVGVPGPQRPELIPEKHGDK